jgi:hypothetical protein
MKYNRHLLFSFLVFSVFLGCVFTSDVRDAAILRARDLGPLPFLEVIRGRDGGFSAYFGNRSVWVFGDTILNRPGKDEFDSRSSTWCWTKDTDAHDGLTDFNEPVDKNGVPGEFLPFTDEELAFNTANNRQDLPNDKRLRVALWPGPVVVDPNTGTAYVFYVKVLARFDDMFNFEAAGYSIAVWENPDKPVVRPVVSPGTRDPTILFPKGDAVVGQGAVVVNEWLYVYGCQTKSLSWPCTVARVTIDEALKREAWWFYAGHGRWSRDWKDAVPQMDAAPMLSVHWNRYLEKYLAIYSTPLRNSFSIRISDAPEGPWSAGRAIVEGLPPCGDIKWNYSGMAHPEFALDKGRVEYLTYYRGTGFLEGETRLVEVVFK